MGTSIPEADCVRVTKNSSLQSPSQTCEAPIWVGIWGHSLLMQVHIPHSDDLLQTVKHTKPSNISFHSWLLATMTQSQRKRSSMNLEQHHPCSNNQALTEIPRQISQGKTMLKTEVVRHPRFMVLKEAKLCRRASTTLRGILGTIREELRLKGSRSMTIQVSASSNHQPEVQRAKMNRSYLNDILFEVTFNLSCYIRHSSD